MTYATQSDLVARFGLPELILLTDRADPPAGSIDATVVAAALADAEAVIDGYLAERYSLPLASVPAMLVGIACDLARFRLHTAEATDAVKERNDQATGTLRDIARGLVTLQVAGAAPVETPDAGPVVAASERVFTAATLRGF